MSSKSIKNVSASVREDLYQLEIKGRLLRIKERMEAMIKNQIRTRKGR